MNLKPIIVALVGVGVVGSAFAATNSTANHTKATPAWQGNSVMAPVQNKIGHSGAYVGVMGNIDAAINHSAFLQASQVTGNPATSHKTNSQFFINNANIFAGFSSQNVDALVNVRYDNRPAVASGTIGGNRSALGVDEAFLVWHTADNGYYAKIGKFFNAFGSYNPYTFIYSPSQMFSQVNGTGLELGASMNGVFANASLYSPNIQVATVTGQRNVDNASFNLGYSNSDFGTFKVGYLLDARTAYTGAQLVGATSKDVGAISVNANLAGSQLGAFSGGFNWLLLEGKNLGLNSKNDAAWFMGFNGAYAFSGLTQQDSVGLGFDMASDSIAKNATFESIVPKYQLTANYGVQINKWVGAGLTYAYSRFDTAAKKISGNTFGLRLSTAF